MAKIRVHELAKEIGKSNREVIDFLVAKGYDVVTAVSVVPESEVANIRTTFGVPLSEEAPAMNKEASEKTEEKPVREERPAGAKKAEENEPPKKRGIVRVFRSQNATRQLQRRPKKPAPAPARAPEKKIEANAEKLVPEEEAVVRVPEIPPLVTEPAADVKEQPVIPAEVQEQTDSRTEVKEKAVPAPESLEPEKAVKKEEQPSGSEAPEKEPETEVLPGPAKADAKAARKEEKTEVRTETADGQTDSGPVKEEQKVSSSAAAEEKKPQEEVKKPAAEEKNAAGADADTGFRNGRVLRNVGSLTPKIPSSGPSASRGRTNQGRGTRDPRSSSERGKNTGERPARPQGQGRYGERTGTQGDRPRGGTQARGEKSFGQNRTAAPGTQRTQGAPGRGFAGAAPAKGPSAAPAGGRLRNAAPGKASGDGDGALARKTTRDFRKDGKERERNKEERRELGHRSDMGGKAGGSKRQFNRIPKALQHKQPQAPQEKKVEEAVTEIRVPERITVRDLAEKMKIASAVIVKELFLKGEMVTVNHELPYEKAEAIALEHDIICEPEEKEDVIGELLSEEAEDEKDMVSRPPVVCVMGHVDHGKTSLLDAIRNTHVTDREAGGITQHIGAYMVSVNGQKITFLDTPGHEAFTAMRMRGANATDIAVLVVAADDGVMPQTVEAINHAKAADTEIIVAVNKIDKPGANIDRVKQELSEYGLISEDWGGSTVFCPVSAKTHEGLDNLLEMILLTADMHELKANPNRKARGIVLEAKLDKGRGPVASILIQKGTLHQGDFIACGAASGKVRAMTDEKGKRLHKATPSMPVEIIGLSAVPEAGEVLVSLDSDKEAKEFAAVFISEGKKNLIEDTKTQMSLDDLFNQIREGNLKELPIVVKADVQGSVEAVSQSLLKLSNEEVVVKVIHGGVGAINESDVSLASASNAIIIGFNVRPDATARAMAENQKVDIHLYNVIYEAIEEVERALKGMRAAVYEEKIQGHAEIRQMFKASGVGNIAGGYVKDGIITRSSKVRVFRAGEKVFEGELASLKRFKDDVKEVREGFECGFVFKDFGDFQIDDMVEAYTMVEVERN